MISPESDPQTELLRSIAASLKAIHSSIDKLTGAVEGVSESIEKAHEPEGDLGVHLVSALKDLSSALHKRSNQERAPQPQQHQERPRQNHPQQQHRRDDRPPLRLELRPPQDRQKQNPEPQLLEPQQSQDEVEVEHSDQQHHEAMDAQRDYDNSESANFESQKEPSTETQENSTAPSLRKPRPSRRRGNRGTKSSADQIPSAPTGEQSS